MALSCWSWKDWNIDPVTGCTHYLLHGVSLTLRAGYSLKLLTKPLGKLANPRKITEKWYLCSSVQHRGISEDIHLSLFRP